MFPMIPLVCYYLPHHSPQGLENTARIFTCVGLPHDKGNCNIDLIQEDERQNDLIERKIEAGRTVYLVKRPVVLEDETHVPHKLPYSVIYVHRQIFLDFV